MTSARVSSRFNVVQALRQHKPHRGIDYAAAVGTPIVASYSGTITVADDKTLHQNYGIVVAIQHDTDTQTLYAHLNNAIVKKGQTIKAGQTIGYVGLTGRTTGPHVHFELHRYGQPVDPSLYLEKRNDINE